LALQISSSNNHFFQDSKIESSRVALILSAAERKTRCRPEPFNHLGLCPFSEPLSYPVEIVILKFKRAKLKVFSQFKEFFLVEEIGKSEER
jgi:hypothetical protein